MPERDQQVKVLWRVGDVLHCSACHKPTYEVTGVITTTEKLSNLRKLLTPASPEVPMLMPETPMRQQPGAAFHCPRCQAEWGVALI